MPAVAGDSTAATVGATLTVRCHLRHVNLLVWAPVADYIPSSEEVRRVWVAWSNHGDDDGKLRTIDGWADFRGAQFDQWLANERAQVLRDEAALEMESAEWIINNFLPGPHGDAEVAYARRKAKELIETADDIEREAEYVRRTKG